MKLRGNARFAAAVSTTVLAGVLALGGCEFGSGMTAEEHLARAKDFYSQGKIPASVIELKNALQRDTRLAEARWLLGLRYLDLGNGPAASKELQHARELGYAAPELEPAILRALVLEGKFEQVLEEATDGSAADESAEVVALRGSAYLGLDRVEEARASFEEALRREPSATEAHLGMAALALSERRFDDGHRHLLEAQRAEPNNLRVWLISGEFELARRATALAEAAFRRALEIVGLNPVARWGLARTLLAQGKPEPAESALDGINPNFAKHPSTQFLRGYAAVQRGDFEKATSLLLQVLKDVSNHPQSLLLLGGIRYTQGQLEQAEELITHFNAAVPNYRPALKLLAAVQLRREKVGAAVDTLESFLEDDSADVQHLALLGNAYIRAGNASRGTTFLRRAADLAPSAAALKTQLALGHLASGETDRAVAELEAAIELEPELLQADVLLVYSHLRNREYDKALEGARRLAEKRPDDPIPHNLVGAAYAAKADFEAARKAFAKALAKDAEFTPAMVNIASLDERTGDVEAARRALERVIELDDANLQARLILARMAFENHDTPLAVRHLETASHGNPGAVEPRVLLASYYLQSAQRDKALATAEEAHRAAPTSPDVLMALGAAQLGNGRYVPAAETFRRLLEVSPGSVDGQYQLGLALSRAGRMDEARPFLERAIALRENYLPALIVLAALELQAGNHEAALRFAAQAQAQHPEVADGYAAQGDILAAQRKYRQAAAAYETALGKGESSLVAMKLHQVRLLAGDRGAAFAGMESWLADHPDDISARLVLAQSFQQENKPDKAIGVYEEILSLDRANVMALNNLAWLFHESGDARAVAYAERAFDLAPEQPTVLDTLGWILVQQGQIERGITLLQRAVDSAPDAPDIRYHFGAGLLKSGARAQARAELQRALASARPFAEKEAAQALFEAIR
jgi:putative PEP-CTERM system TPR-repeat lipoprotein